MNGLSADLVSRCCRSLTWPSGQSTFERIGSSWAMTSSITPAPVFRGGCGGTLAPIAQAPGAGRGVVCVVTSRRSCHSVTERRFKLGDVILLILHHTTPGSWCGCDGTLASFPCTGVGVGCTRQPQCAGVGPGVHPPRNARSGGGGGGPPPFQFAIVRRWLITPCRIEHVSPALGLFFVLRAGCCA